MAADGDSSPEPAPVVAAAEVTEPAVEPPAEEPVVEEQAAFEEPAVEPEPAAEEPAAEEPEEAVVAGEEIAATGADGIGTTLTIAMLVLLAGGLMVAVARAQEVVSTLAAEAPQEEVPRSPVHGEGRAPAREVVSMRARASAHGYPNATRQNTI